MKEYKRLTDKKIDLDKLSEKAKSRISDTYIEYAKMNNALWEIENKIENGTLIPVESLNEQGYYKSEGLGWNNPIWIALIMSMLSGNIDFSKLPPDVQDELNKLKEQDNDR